MKLFIPIALITILFACKKEKEKDLPRLTFTKEDKQWLVYQAGQKFKFKNDLGDSLVYTVISIEQSFYRPEYKDTNYTIVAYTESYEAKLTSATDTINIYFYKTLQYSDDPNKLRQTIRWLRMKGYFVKLAALEYNASFTHKTVNGLTYTTVTPAVPQTDLVYPSTQFDKAFYDQGAGLIEIIDLSGASWKRVY
ncbi:MAG TPA: hypothetical protein VF008_25430 [Niastella sp.]